MQVKSVAMNFSSRRYWLLKTEPDCFSLKDLKGRPHGIEPWDGVRNYQARNLLRDQLQVDDGVFIYHSNIAEPAIVGVARVVRAGYPDLTALDPQAEHFDPRATEANPVWYRVDVQYVAELPHLLTRRALSNHPLLAGMDVLMKGNRLSVQPVTPDEWRAALVAGGLDHLD